MPFSHALFVSCYAARNHVLNNKKGVCPLHVVQIWFYLKKKKKDSDDSYPNHINPSWWHSFHRFKVQTTNLVFFFLVCSHNMAAETRQIYKIEQEYLDLNQNKESIYPIFLT